MTLSTLDHGSHHPEVTFNLTHGHPHPTPRGHPALLPEPQHCRKARLVQSQQIGGGESTPAHHLHLSTQFVQHPRQQQPGTYLQYEKSIHYPKSRKATRPEPALIKLCPKICPKPCSGGPPRLGQPPHHSQSPVRGQALESSLNPWLQGGCMFCGRSELLHQMCLRISTTWKGSWKDLGCRRCWQYSKISIRWMASVLANRVNA